MKRRALLHLLCVFEVFQKGGTALIETQQSVLAAFRGDAHFTCRLMQTKDVVQVTWRELFPDRVKFVASYTKEFGERVSSHLRDKVAFTHAALQSSAIVVRNVTDQDEGCYQCVFNTYPEGAFTNMTCLQVYELHEPVLHVEESPEEAVLSCSVTGRPAPAVTLSVLRRDLHLSRHSSVTVNNANGTATVTTTAVLSGFHGSAKVGCAVQVLSGPQVEVFRTLPENKELSPDVTLIIVFVLIGLLCVCAAPLIISRLKRKHGNRDSENHKTPLKSTQPTQGTKTPVVQHENENLRQRESTIKKDKTATDGKSSKATSFKPKCMRLLFETKSTL